MNSSRIFAAMGSPSFYGSDGKAGVLIGSLRSWVACSNA
jgi:hypothetical protein